MTDEDEHHANANRLRVARWSLIGLTVVGVVMVSALTYLALARDGGTSAWVMAAVWFVGVTLTVGVGLRSLASR